MATRRAALPSGSSAPLVQGSTTGTVALLLVVAAAVRLWTVGDKNIWLDEAASWDVASLQLPDLLRRVAGDVHPPLYYLLLKGWMTLAGDSPIALRSLSVAFGVIAVGLAYRLAVRWLSRSAAIVTLAWLAVSPHLIFYSQEARMYAPATAFALAACLAYRRWVESGFARPGRLAAFAVAMTGALYLHYFTALVLVALWTHLAVARRPAVGERLPRSSTRGVVRDPTRAPNFWRDWLVTNAAVLAACLPWIPTAAAQIVRGQSWRADVSPADLPFYAGWLGKSLLAGYHEGWTPLLAVALAVLAAVVAAGWVPLIARQLGPQGGGESRDEGDVWLVLLAVVPVVGSLAAMPVTGGLDLGRYLAFLTPLVMIGAARGLSMLRAGGRGASAIIALGVGASIPWSYAWSQDPTKDADVQPVVRALAVAAGHDPSRTGTVLVEPGSMILCLLYYTQDFPVRLKRVPADVSPWRALQTAARRPADGPVWLVVAREAVAFDRDGGPAPPRLKEIALEPSRPDRVRLLRLVSYP